MTGGPDHTNMMMQFDVINNNSSCTKRSHADDSKHMLGPLKKRPFRPWSPPPPAAAPLDLIVTRVPTPDSPLDTLNDLNNNTNSNNNNDPPVVVPSREHQQRNYKNMTRERRIEANARERTRVHTISAAFETLRKAIPSYSNNQKLSKLSVLRIACSYIMTLGTIVNNSDCEDISDVSSDSTTSLSTVDCINLVTKTIRREGKLRKKKDDSTTTDLLLCQNVD